MIDLGKKQEIAEEVLTEFDDPNGTYIADITRKLAESVLELVAEVRRLEKINNAIIEDRTETKSVNIELRDECRRLEREVEWLKSH